MRTSGTASDDEEESQRVEVDEDEVGELEEAAGRELRAAAAALSGLPFEDKVKLVGALSPAAAAALMGVCAHTPRVSQRAWYCGTLWLLF